MNYTVGNSCISPLNYHRTCIFLYRWSTTHKSTLNHITPGLIYSIHFFGWSTAHESNLDLPCMSPLESPRPCTSIGGQQATNRSQIFSVYHSSTQLEQSVSEYVPFGGMVKNPQYSTLNIPCMSLPNSPRTCSETWRLSFGSVFT